MTNSQAINYGDLYWCVKVIKELSPDGEIYLNADAGKPLRV